MRKNNKLNQKITNFIDKVGGLHNYKRQFFYSVCYLLGIFLDLIYIIFLIKRGDIQGIILNLLTIIFVFILFINSSNNYKKFKMLHDIAGGDINEAKS